MSGFRANVAARKPRTGIARVISDMTSQRATDESAAETVDLFDKPVEARAAEARPVEPRAVEPRAVDTKPEARPVEARSAEATPVVPIRKPVAEEKPAAAVPRAPGGREQVERLRERLAAAARSPSADVEPQRTAQAVRELVESLRAKLDNSVKERAELGKTLEEVRAALARAEADLKKERRMRAAVEAVAEERQRIADDAVAEAEALASERDQVLADLAEHRRLEKDQAALLLEAEEVLGRRDAERASAAKDLAEMREFLEMRIADVADLEARLQSEITERTRIEARCKELERELARLNQANEALEALEAMTRVR